MRPCHVTGHAPRSGFTLVEMLVVLAIILILASLLVAYGPRIETSRRTLAGADLLQGAIGLAKQRAIRDGIPRGIRILGDPTTNTAMTLQYIEQPADYRLGVCTLQNASTATLNADVTEGFTDQALWSVQPGDFLEINNTGPQYLIAAGGVSFSPTPTPTTTITVTNNNLPVGTNATSYRIIRAPRPIAGEQAMELPQDVVIDLGTGRSLPDGTAGAPNLLPAPTGNPDIMFLPSGEVRRPGLNSSKIILWVRHRDISIIADQTLITIYTRTGLIAAHPFNPADPYSFTRDGRSSGM